MRFDGVRSAVFDSANTPALQNGLITSLYEDSHGVLWIGHETGHLTRLTRGTFESVVLGLKWPGGNIESITADQEGDVWLLNDSGVLFRLRDGETNQVPGGASATRKVGLTRASNGRIWIVSNGNISFLDRGQITRFIFSDNSPSDYVERLLPAHDGGLWILANQRLRKWKENRWVTELDIGGRSPGTISVLLETAGGRVLAGTLREGLFLFRPGAPPLRFTRTDGLSHDWVRALCEDHEGNLWVGTSAGLDGLRRRKVQMLSPPDEWEGCSVLSFALEPHGSAWIGTEGAGLYHFSGEEWKSFSEVNGLSNLYVWSVLRRHSGELCVGTFGGGLLVNQGDRFESSGDLGKITAPVVALYEGRNGELWIGTTIGLYRYEGGRLSWFAGKDRLAFPDVRAITETAEGALWFGMSGGGLGNLKDGKLKQFRKSDGLGSDLVVCLYAETDGTLWIGTSDHGLTRFREGRFATITTAQGLPSSIITHLVADDGGNLWMGSHRGILRASLLDLNRCADGAASSVQFLAYGRAEGLASQACSGGFQPGAVKGTDGRIWFPTSKGLAIVDPKDVTTNAIPPPVVIEELLVDDKPVQSVHTGDSDRKSRSAAAAIEIAPGNHRFQVRYTGLSFVSPEKVQFKYILEGLEDQWREAGSERFADYSYLRPGDYTFRVTAANNDGVWNDIGASLSFRVLPFLWQTWWFQAVSLSVGAGAVGSGALWASRRRVRLKLEQLERQRALERERARIARDIHDDLGASLTRITMLSQSVRSEVEDRKETAEEVDHIYLTARELTRAMDEIVWAVNPRHDTLDSLVTYLGRFAQQFLSAAGIRCRLDVPVNLPAWALTSEVRHNVFLAFKEALHNVLQHARATEVRVSVELQSGGFKLTIADNGCGFDTPAAKLNSTPRFEGTRLSVGNGVYNMRKRLEEVGGRCEWETAPGEGTRVKFWISVH
jgi:signal transduction histidine kinase/ligand-binding sensor domain-containing protein